MEYLFSFMKNKAGGMGMGKKICVLCFCALIIFVFGCYQAKQYKKCVDSYRLPKFAEGAKYVGSERCAECHDELSEKFKDNIHARIAEFEVKTTFASTGCEACHGPGSRHADAEEEGEDGAEKLIINPASVDSQEASAICLQCHTDGETMDWHGSEHALNEISCLKCHAVHGKKDKVAYRNKLGYRHKHVKDALLKKPEPELCFTCHKDIMAKTNYPNHHPVKEGKITCSECHNPHGSSVEPLLRTDERKNELCFKCHMDKQGPFTFEHAPVVEDCTICHEPHGTVADNLLKQNEPFLCLQCHGIHFHAGLRPDTEFLENAGVTGPTTRVQPHDNSMQMAFMTRCTQCHPSIHGSDLPSLSVPGGGSRLTK